ncbi:MAG: nitroreductase [Dokdonella sp.]
MIIEPIESRLSVPSRQLGAPGPDSEQLQALMHAALRVPDHGKLEPWRLILIRGGARMRFGAALAEIHARIDTDVPDSVLEKDRTRYTFAPLIVAVIARITANHPKVPVQEQILSSGCVAYNLLLGAQALGFGAQWLTGWAAYDRDVAALLGLADNESVIAFVHIGSSGSAGIERTRPQVDALVSDWDG